MKKRILCKLLAIASVGTLLSGEVLTVSASSVMSEENLTIESEIAYADVADAVPALSYSYTYDYVQPNDSVTLSPSSVKASDVVKAASSIIFANEGSYSSVNVNDNGALSIGKIQWHGNNALSLVRAIIAENPSKAYTLLGEDLYNEATTTSGWSTRILTSAEKTKFQALLNSTESKTIQDKMADSYISTYVNHGTALGIQNAAALVYYADLENQGGYGASKRCASRAYNLVGGYSKVTLNELHIGAFTDSVMGAYKPRRNLTYSKAAALGWTYCNTGDSLIPYKELNTGSATGVTWLQWALNTYAGANIAVTGTYDSATATAVKNFQKSAGLTADGIAGNNTFYALMMKIVNANAYYSPGSAAKWIQSGGRWWYRHADGSYTTSGWEKIDGKWYLFDKDGWMLTGWQYYNGSWYYLYSSGAMAADTWINDYYVDASGAWIPGKVKDPVNESEYPVPTRTLQSGCTGDDVKWLQQALNVINGANLTVDGIFGNGVKTAVINFQNKMGLAADGIVGQVTRTAILNALNGTSASSAKWIKSGNRWWYRHADGSYTTSGWEKIDGKWYLFDKDGWMLTGWQKVNGKWYYMNSSGAMLTGWQKINGKWYYLDSSGAMLTGWQKINSKWYYLDSSGAMASDTWIGEYYVDASGAWIPGKVKDTSDTNNYPVPTRTLKEGCTGDDVKWLQQSLNTVMGASLTVDGIYGSGVKAAVEAFQTKAALTADGIFGAQSLAALKALL